MVKTKAVGYLMVYTITMGNDDDVSFSDLFNPKQPRSDKDLYDERMAICKLCEHFNSKAQKCKKCGCFMRLKTTLLAAKCPVGKW